LASLVIEQGDHLGEWVALVGRSRVGAKDGGQLTSGRSGSLVERADDDVGHPHRQGLEVEVAVRNEDAFSPRGVRCRDRSDDCRIAHCVVDSGAADTRSDTFSIRKVT